MRLITSLFLSIFLVSCSETERLPKGNAIDSSHYSHQGFFTKRDVAVGANDSVSWVQYSLKDFKSAEVLGVPAGFTMLKEQAGCRFDHPAAGSTPIYVNVGSIWTSRVYAITDYSVASASKKVLKQYRAQGKIVDSKRVAGGTKDSMDVIDVIVTDTSKPLHLVLAGSQIPLWNIHAFEGVTITGVSLLGGHTVGVVGLDPAIPVSYMTTDKLESCKIKPVQKPSTKWTSVGQDKNRFAELNGLFNTFDLWFSKTFGPLKQENSIFAARTRHVLIGDVPATLEARMPHRSMRGATVQVSPTTQVIAAEPKDYREFKLNLAMQNAQAEAGVPLASLHTPR